MVKKQGSPIDLGFVQLKCPECGKEHTSYKEHFEHWTGHYQTLVKSAKASPYEHSAAIEYYKQNPQAIEPGLRVIATEVGVFRGRIDIIGLDREGLLVIADVSNEKDTKRKPEQLRRYVKSIRWMGTNVYGVSIPGKIRLLVINPNGEVKEIES